MTFNLRWSRRKSTALALSCSVLTGCTVGPNYKGTPAVGHGALQAPAFQRAQAVPAAEPAPAAAAWWRTLKDPQLTQLIETGLAASPDVHAAQARLKQARAGLSQQKRNYLPKGSASASYLYAQLPGSTGLPLGSVGFYNLGFDATWEVDVFGGTRRAVESAAASAEGTAADLADTQVQLSAEIAQNYVSLRDLQQRRALVRESVEVEQQMLTLTQERRTQGVATEIDVERIRTQVETTRADLIPIDEQIIEALDSLALLTAREPGTLDAELGADKALPQLPERVPIGDPAALLKQRPDIRGAEWRLVSQNAQIGMHEADWFPKLTLIGDVGVGSTGTSNLLSGNNLVWIGAPMLQWNILDFGRTQLHVEQARAAVEEAAARYEGTVLGALRDANDALSRYGHQRDSVASLTQVEAAAARTAELTQQRYRAGASSALEWLDAERTRFSAQQNRVAAQAELIKDYVALHKSLGLGWQTQKP
jgi:NodT family efflux transporter outer membrane factor (OMF) lipoprotein